jgi:hypothetical protein
MKSSKQFVTPDISSAHRGERQCRSNAWELIIVCCISTIPFLVLFWYVTTYGVNVPFYDDWGYIPLLKKSLEGHLHFADVWTAQGSAHRFFVPFSLALIIDTISHYNAHTRMYVDCCILSLQTLLLMAMAYSRCRSIGKTLFLIAPIPWLALNLKQWDTLLWDFPTTYFCGNFFAVLTIYLLDRAKSLGLAFWSAIASGFCVTLSYANGLLIWPLCLAQLAIKHFANRKTSSGVGTKMILIWSASLVITVFLFFFGYHHTDIRTSSPNFTGNLLQFTNFVITYIGGGLTAQPQAALLTGGLLLALCATICGLIIGRRIRLDVWLAAPLMLVIYGIASGCLMALGRMQFGSDYAISSRYASLDNMFLIGLYLIAVLAVYTNQRLSNSCATLLALLAIAGSIAIIPDALQNGEGRRSTALMWSAQLQSYKQQNDETLHHIYESVDRIRMLAPFLESHHLSVFADAYQVASLVEDQTHKIKYGVDSVNSSSLLSEKQLVTASRSADSDITISGWALDLSNRTPCAGAFVTLDDNTVIPAAYGLTRSEIARAFRHSHYARCGFAAHFNSSLLDKGEHKVAVGLILPGGKSIHRTKSVITLKIK